MRRLRMRTVTWHVNKKLSEAGARLLTINNNIDSVKCWRTAFVYFSCSQVRHALALLIRVMLPLLYLHTNVRLYRALEYYAEREAMDVSWREGRKTGKSHCSSFSMRFP